MGTLQEKIDAMQEILDGKMEEIEEIKAESTRKQKAVKEEIKNYNKTLKKLRTIDEQVNAMLNA